MTREKFDQLDSDGKVPCPDCGLTYTQPYPGCGCPSNAGGYGTRHINKWHHNCEESQKRWIKYDKAKHEKLLEEIFSKW